MLPTIFIDGILIIDENTHSGTFWVFDLDASQHPKEGAQTGQT